jgi:hypothetical protein
MQGVPDDLAFSARHIGSMAMPTTAAYVLRHVSVI